MHLTAFLWPPAMRLRTISRCGLNWRQRH